MGLLKDAQEPYQTLVQTAAASISDAPAGAYHLFVDVDGLFKLKDSAGVVTEAGASTYAVPTIVLDTTPAEGSAPTALRSDATILAFDATDPTDGTFDDVANTGFTPFAARRDHTHGWPAQAAAIADTSAAALADLETEVNLLKAALRTAGIIAT